MNKLKIKFLSKITNKKPLLTLSFIFFIISITGFVIILGLNGVIVFRQHVFGFKFDIICILITISIILFIYFYYSKFKTINIFSYPIWITLNIYFQIIFNVWILQRNNQFSSIYLLHNQDEIATSVLMLLWFGLIIVWISWMIPDRHKIEKIQISGNVTYKPQIKIMFIVWFITWFINIFATVAGSQGYLNTNTNFSGNNYIFFVNIINDILTLNLMMLYFIKPYKYGFIWLVFAIVTKLFITFLIGTKSGIFIFLFLLMSYYFVHNKFPKRWLTIGLVAVILIVPIITNFRVNLFYAGFDRTSGANFFERLPLLTETITRTIKTPVEDLLGQTRETLESRQGSIFGVTAAFLVTHPEYKPFVLLDLIDVIRITIVPRFIWPNKPSNRPSLYNISMEYFGARQELSFSTPGQIADAFRIGGYLFVFLWMMITSRFMLSLYNKMISSRNIPVISFYLILILNILSYDNSLFIVIMRSIQFGIILYFLNHFLFFKKTNLELIR